MISGVFWRRGEQPANDGCIYGTLCGRLACCIGFGSVVLTLTRDCALVYAGACHHHIVYDGEAALTAYPVTILGLDATVDQRSCSIGLYAALMQMLCVGYVLWREKFPARPFNDIFWSIAKDVYDGVGSI